MASLVHLVRHGEVDNPGEIVYADLPGFRLSDRGRSQASRTARHLGSQPVVAVWSSPLERALQTAAIIASRFGLPVLVDDALTEWRLSHRWAGTRWDELDRRFPGELDAYMHDPADLSFSPESLIELAGRVRGAVETIASRHDAGDVVVVGHQDPIQAARLALTGRSLVGLQNDKPGHATVITLRPRDGWREIASFTPE
jgi:broad specificity phosphatase PhoE